METKHLSPKRSGSVRKRNPRRSAKPNAAGYQSPPKHMCFRSPVVKVPPAPTAQANACANAARARVDRITAADRTSNLGGAWIEGSHELTPVTTKSYTRVTPCCRRYGAAESRPTASRSPRAQALTPFPNWSVAPPRSTRRSNATVRSALSGAAPASSAKARSSRRRMATGWSCNSVRLTLMAAPFRSTSSEARTRAVRVSSASKSIRAVVASRRRAPATAGLNSRRSGRRSLRTRLRRNAGSRLLGS